MKGGFSFQEEVNCCSHDCKRGQPRPPRIQNEHAPAFYRELKIDGPLEILLKNELMSEEFSVSIRKLGSKSHTLVSILSSHRNILFKGLTNKRLSVVRAALI